MTETFEVTHRMWKVGPYVFGGSVRYPRKKYGFPFFSRCSITGGQYVTIGPVMLTTIKLTPKELREGHATPKQRPVN